MKKRILSVFLCCVLIVTSVFSVSTINASAAITVYSQTDSRWASHPYGYSNTAGTQRATISSGGCGILAYVNAVYYLNGKFIEPTYLADWSVSHGYRINGVGTSHGLYKAFADSEGSTYQISYAGTTSSYSTLANHLKTGGVAIGSAPGHLMAVVDYDSSNGKFLILDSYKSSNRYTYQTGYTWQTESSCRNTAKLQFSTFILISGTGPAPTPTVLTVDGNYSKYMPLTAYLSVNNTVYPCDKSCSTQTGGQIWTSDECTIKEVYTNGWCMVDYPGSGGTKTAYTQLSNFIPNTSKGFSQATASKQIFAYSRADFATSIGYADPGDSCYLVGTSGSATQIIYPTPSGKKLGWTRSSDWIVTPLPGPDERFNPYCPIRGYIKGTTDVAVYNSDFSTPSGGEIWADDYCTINAVYNNGWCQVTYPSVVTSSGSATGFVPLSAFVHDTSATPVSYTANAQINVYTRSDMTNTPRWWVSAGDKFFKISTSGNVCQVLYPVDAQYGGGYKIGWIYTSQLPVTTYTVSYNANGGSGAPSSQTKRQYESLTLSSTTPTKTGYTFAGWATSSSSSSVVYTPGATYTSDSNITLYAVWNPVKYEISYNMNGGFANISNQTKAYASSINLSSVVPEKSYGVYFYAYEDEMENTTKVVECEFLGWNTSKTATTASYQPGATFTTNANVTLYAVWSDPVVGNLDTPTKDGYEFLGWYTQETGGTRITENTVITEDTTVYAHWKANSTPTPSTYTITYNANGGTNAPASQTKTEDVNLVLTKSVPKRDGYTFKGWATSASSQTVAYKAGATYTANANATLYAVWEKNIDTNASAFVVSDVSAKAGSTVTVDISIKNNPGITAFNFSVDYPEEVMALTGVEYKTLFSSKASGSKTMTSPFIISWFSTLSEDETSNGVIATLTFKVNEDVEAGSYPINLTYDENNVFDLSFTNIVFAVDNGDVIVTDYIPGDVNGDTVVNMKDIVLLQQYLNDWDVTIDEAAANVNGDTSVNMKDIVLLQQYLNEWDVELK